MGNNVVDHVESTKNVQLEDLGQFLNVGLLSDGTEISGSSIVDCSMLLADIKVNGWCCELTEDIDVVCAKAFECLVDEMLSALDGID